MNMIITYGILIAFFVFIVFLLEITHRPEKDFTDYAVAGRTFGSWFQAMSFVNTWLPGTVFIAFAGLAAGVGILGFYVISYSLLAVFLMFLIAKPVFRWGKHFDLRTQADFVGMRYNSKAVRVISAFIGVVSIFPWLILAFQSVGMLFYFLSYGAITFTQAVIVGVVALGIRQVWTVRMGVRGIVISDMAQGIAAYGGGGLIALGFIIWFMQSGHGFNALPEDFATLPGTGSEAGPLYYFSLVFTGAFGALCWPDMFVRLFTGSGTKVIKRSAQISALIILVFTSILLVMSMLASTLPGISESPDRVWFLVAELAGPIVLGLASVAVFGAAMGNANALAASIGTHTAQDIIHVNGANDDRITRSAKIVIAIASILAIIGGIITVDWTSGLFLLAVAAYQGVVQLAPSLYFGIFWKRGNATGAIAGMVVGFVVAVILQVLYPISIPWLVGLTSGVGGLIINVIVYVGCAYMLPVKSEEANRVEELFAHLGDSQNQSPDTSNVASTT